MLQNSVAVFVLLFIMSLFISCQFNVVYDKVVAIENSKWEKNKLREFNVDINDTVSLYDFYLVVYNTTEYRYSNFFVFLSTEFPNGNLSRDTIECILADASGRWHGKGWSNVKETDILLKSNLKFPLKGNYKFSIQQAMRNDTLIGINRIGLRLVKTF